MSETVELPIQFVRELYEYFFTKLPMNQSELVIIELRKALDKAQNGD